MGEIEQTNNQGGGEKSENVRVAVRMRPMNEGEQARGDLACLKADNDTTLIISQKFKMIDAGGPKKVTSSTTC
jgi:hypothetical protein